MQSRLGFERRTFLVTVAGGLAARPLQAARPRYGSLTPEEFREQLNGPITSIPTVFTSDFRVDHDGVRKIIDTGVKSGSKVFALTAGDSRYDDLTYEEIKRLTRTVVEGVAARGLTIAATGSWWTGQVIDYARFASDLGADSIQVKLPLTGTEDALYEHYRKVATATKRAIVLHGQAPMPLLKRLMEIDSIVACKDEYPAMYTMEMFAHYAKRLNIFSGGQMSRFLTYQPYGMRAFFSAFSAFAPEVQRQFWNAVEHGDMDAAQKVMFRYDIPFFERFSHPFWRATLEYFGIAGRYLRPPERTFALAEVRALKPFYDSLGLAGKSI